MLQMLSCFNLRPGVELGPFQGHVTAFATHMREIDLVEAVGPVMRRVTDTPLDTDRVRDHAFFFTMDFRDRAQADASYAYLARREAPGWGLHQAVFGRVEDAIFICWESPVTPLAAGGDLR